MNAIQVTALILFIASLLPLTMCLVKIYLLKKYKLKATITAASVIASEKKRGFKNSTYYLLDINYVVHTGLNYSAKTITWKKYETGDKIPLMYLTDDPGNFKTDFGQSLKWFLAVSIIFATGIIYFCYWLLIQEYSYSPS